MTIPEIKSEELRPVIVNHTPAKNPIESEGLYSKAGAALSESLEGPPTDAVCPVSVRPLCPEKVEWF